MAVILNSYDDLCRGGAVENEMKCCICNERVFYPYLVWDVAKKQLHICGQCCCNIKDGLVADLIHITAVKELGKIYPEMTLVRENHKALEKREKEINNTP